MKRILVSLALVAGIIGTAAAPAAAAPSHGTFRCHFAPRSCI